MKKTKIFCKKVGVKVKQTEGYQQQKVIVQQMVDNFKETDGYQEQKVFFQQVVDNIEEKFEEKLDAEKARMANKYNQKQQAELEAGNATQTTVDVQPAIDTAQPQPAVIDQTPATVQESTLATVALTAAFPMPQETEGRTTNSFDAEIEIGQFLVNTAKAVDAINFDDSSDSDSDAQSVNAIALTAAEEV